MIGPPPCTLLSRNPYGDLRGRSTDVRCEGHGGDPLLAPVDPLLGDWLTEHAQTGDLSSSRKVTLGPDEISPDGSNLDPALRLVYRLLPSNADARQVEVFCIGPRRDLIAYAVAAARLRQD